MRRASFAACVFSFLATGSAVAQGVPSLPQNPKSQSECSDWGRAYQSWWDAFLSKVRQNDASCKAHYPGKYTTIQSLCGNTLGGPVTHQNPCDEVTKYTQCEWIGFFRGMGACLTRVAELQKPTMTNAPGATEEAVLEPDDIAFVQKIAKQDEFIRKLSESAGGADGLARILSVIAAGPAKLAVQWDQALIRGWRQANKGLDVLNKHAICEEISYHSLDTKALQYFNDLYRARGCDQY
jgi:hypothetical protein